MGNFFPYGNLGIRGALHTGNLLLAGSLILPVAPSVHGDSLAMLTCAIRVHLFVAVATWARPIAVGFERSEPLTSMLPRVRRADGEFPWEEAYVSINKNKIKMYKCMEFRKQPPPILTLSLFSNKRCCVAFNNSATQIGHVRYIKILTWPRGFLVIFLYFGLVFFVRKSLLGIARQWSRKKNVRIFIYRKWAIWNRF